jgi:nucleoside-diphosphate-sugar epimerase
MNILVTGADGYLGSLLTPRLMADGHEVVGLDTGFFRGARLYPLDHDVQPQMRWCDLRKVSAEDFEGFDAVVHMAELSNDPAGALNPQVTYEINHQGTVRLAELARRAGVRRFVYMSSCSVYGAADGDEAVTEMSSVNPQTAYAECKLLCERDLKTLASGSFTPVFLRNATAFGASPRQRFDLVVNDLCGLAWTTGEIRMTSDGSPWRPLVHGLDIARAIQCALSAPADTVRGEIFNVGSNEQNYRIREIAEIVGRVFPDCEVKLGDNGSDRRSYRVGFDRIHEAFPEFSCEWDVERGVRQFRALFEYLALSEPMFRSRPFIRLRQLEHLLQTAQIDDRFFWKEFPLTPSTSFDGQAHLSTRTFSVA